MAHYESIGHFEDPDFDAKGRMKTESFGADGLPVFFVVYAPWCGHCQKAAPHFEKLARKYHNNGVFIAALNAADESPKVKKLAARIPKILAKDGINFQGFPTFVLYKNGKYIEYNGPRTVADMSKFLDSHL